MKDERQVSKDFRFLGNFHFISALLLNDERKRSLISRTGFERRLISVDEIIKINQSSAATIGLT